MTRDQLIQEIKDKKSFLCVGLDTDITKIPEHLFETEDPIFEFNKQIIDATKDYAVAYKPNIAFYEALGISGWNSLRKTIEYIPENIFTIADAKRGDIGNTAKYYAEAFFEELNCDSITIAPYMGEDSVTPFLEFENKWAIVLGLTSNKGALDFQNQKLESGKYLFEEVVSKTASWGTDENIMFVVGATRGELISKVRQNAPTNFFLVPGIGAQGGSLEDVCSHGMTKDVSLLVNSSRGIIYASNGVDFADKAKEKAKEVQQQMESILKEKGIV